MTERRPWLYFIQLQEKKARLVGMASFSALLIFMLWYVDYEQMDTVGFGPNPIGYDSVAYKLLSYVFDDSYRHSALSRAWTLTQAVPFAASWGIRVLLGRCVLSIEAAVGKVYDAV